MISIGFKGKVRWRTPKERQPPKEQGSLSAPDLGTCRPGKTWVSVHRPEIGEKKVAPEIGPEIGIALRFETVRSTSEQLNVLTCTGNWHYDLACDLSTGSNHKSRALDLWSELPKTAIWERFLRFWPCNFKSLVIGDMWLGALSQWKIIVCAAFLLFFPLHPSPPQVLLFLKTLGPFLN